MANALRERRGCPRPLDAVVRNGFPFRPGDARHLPRHCDLGHLGFGKLTVADRPRLPGLLELAGFGCLNRNDKDLLALVILFDSTALCDDDVAGQHLTDLAEPWKVVWRVAELAIQAQRRDEALGQLREANSRK